MPLISVPSIFLIFRLILDNPSLILMKSALIPIPATLSSIWLPVNPAMYPSAVFLIPRLLRSIDTLIPFPPGVIISEAVLLVIPS